MFEIIVLFMVGCLIAACAYSPHGWFMAFFAKFSRASGAKPAVNMVSNAKTASTDSEPASSFLEQLQVEIETTLFPRPTDSVLKRHYDNLVAVEIQNRLSHFS